MNTRGYVRWAVIAAVCVGSLGIAAEGKRKEPAKAPAKTLPARINFSSNFQGELEPCG